MMFEAEAWNLQKFVDTQISLLKTKMKNLCDRKLLLVLRFCLAHH